MPFLTTSSPTFCPTKFYIVHEASPHLGTNILIQKMAAVFFKQKKKVLIFDALLGLKNMPINNKNQSKIPAVFKRQLPISELITHEKGIDIISGVSCQNFTALTSCQQQYIKASLQQLAHNYDIVLINVPFQITDSIWDDMGENLWVISEKKEIIRKTLLLCQNQQKPHLLFNPSTKDISPNHIYAFIKILSPNCQITFFEDKQ